MRKNHNKKELAGMPPDYSSFLESPGEETDSINNIETTFITQTSPMEMKRNSLKHVLENYTFNEIAGIVATIEGGENLPMSQVIDCLTAGHFNVTLESSEAENIHKNIVADLLPSFIECVRMQGLQMNEEIASHSDVLHDSWDRRTPEARKLHKLKALIVNHGNNDPDLISAIDDIEELYTPEDSAQK